MPAPSLDTITRVVAAEWGVDVTLLRSEQRTRTVTVPRGVAYVLARELTDLTWSAIAACFGRGVRGAITARHATVVRIETDKHLRARVNRVRTTLRKGADR